MDNHNPFGVTPLGAAPTSRVAAATTAPAANNMSALLAARQNAFSGKAPQQVAVAPGKDSQTANSGGGISSSSGNSSSGDLRIAAPSRPAVISSQSNPSPMQTNPNAWTGQGLLLQPHWALDVTAEESGGAPLKGEVPVFRDVECYLRGPMGQRVPGLLTATTYQLRFTPGSAMPPSMRHQPLSAFAVPVSSIRKIERPKSQSKDALGMSSGGPTPLLDITSKDVRVMSLGFRDEQTADKMATHLRLIAFPPKLDFVHAFTEGVKLSGLPAGSVFPGWDIYEPRAELERLGVLAIRHPRSGEPLYRITEVNAAFAYAPTYPSVIVTPHRFTDAMLHSVAGFRSKARIPALTWMHPGNKTTMWRCSQPRVGMGGNSNAQDELLLAMVRESNVYSRDPHQPLLIADCRPRANAMANKAGGWGYEVYPGTQLEFLNMHNIHAVRDSHRGVEALCLNHSPADINWAATLSETAWLYHLRTVLSAGLFVAEAMHRKGQNVLVHCSDGWDRTAQVCGLVQVMLDPFSRTVRGFGRLIHKDWMSFGHKFGERAGHMEDKDGGDISPVFVQFLDAVWQLVRLFPYAFEFDGRMLLFVAHHVYSCRFGDFLVNSDKERAEGKLATRTQSVFGHVISRPELFRNEAYNPSGGDILLPHPSVVLRNVTLWSDWFLRWSPYPSAAAECRMEKYADTVYDRAPVIAAALAIPEVVERSILSVDVSSTSTHDLAIATTSGEGALPSILLTGSPSVDGHVTDDAEGHAYTAFLARDEGDVVGSDDS